MIIYCATSNPGKLKEFRLAARHYDIQAVNIPQPEENGATFEENALKKALYYGSHIRGYLFADDSGLVVDALGGAPGIRSARFAGPNATDADNNALLLERLRGIENRCARFVCAIALVLDGKPSGMFWAEVEGRIVEEPRGSNGFGYDPLFYYEPFGCTFGEASIEQKMRVSHRAQAFRALFAFLDSKKIQSSS